jgi:hypothetical protein
MRKKKEESHGHEDSRDPITNVGVKLPGRVTEPQMCHVG